MCIRDSAYIDRKLDVIRESDIVIFQLEIPLETVVYAAKKAKEMGKTVILDPAPAVPELPEELLRCADLIKPNETELGILLGDPQAKERLAESADHILAHGVKNVLISLGGSGAYLKGAGGLEHRFYTTDVPVVDTTAAGDSFTAAVAVRLAQGGDLVSAIEFADRVSTVVVTRKGAQSSISSMQEVEEFFAALKQS